LKYNDINNLLNLTNSIDIMKRLFLGIVLTILILLGFFLLYKVIYVYPKYDGKNPLNINLIESQSFNINVESDTILMGSKGTLIRIKKNSFQDSKGNIVQGEVNIELKEVISKVDIILSGLSTTSDGKLLETSGMIFLKAKQDKQVIDLRDDYKIGIVVPAELINRKMKVFTGTLSKGMINWQNPERILNNVDSVRYGIIPESLLDIYGLERARFISDSIGIIGIDTPLKADSLMQLYDSLYNEYRSSAQFISDSLANSERDNLPDILSSAIEGQIHYAFEINNIGWINIDRFIEQNETEEVDFSVTVTNINNFQSVYIKLILLDFNTYLSAFQINNNQFVIDKSFSPKTQLPLKCKAIILATAYDKGIPYYDLKEIYIQREQIIKLNLKKTSSDELKAEIMSIF
jgi:hypothetical protein